MQGIPSISVVINFFFIEHDIGSCCDIHRQRPWNCPSAKVQYSCTKNNFFTLLANSLIAYMDFIVNANECNVYS